jgi:hypothetical protein
VWNISVRSELSVQKKKASKTDEHGMKQKMKIVCCRGRDVKGCAFVKTQKEKKMDRGVAKVGQMTRRRRRREGFRHLARDRRQVQSKSPWICHVTVKLRPDKGRMPDYSRKPAPPIVSTLEQAPSKPTFTHGLWIGHWTCILPSWSETLVSSRSWRLQDYSSVGHYPLKTGCSPKNSKKKKLSEIDYQVPKSKLLNALWWRRFFTKEELWYCSNWRIA